MAVEPDFTRKYLQSSNREALVKRIDKAFDRVAWERDFVLCEGSGHAGVGSVFDLSNARVARLLGAKVIIVCQGGIGKPIDEVSLNQALFEKEGVEVIGVILNKVLGKKVDSITEFARRGLRRKGRELLGVLPHQPLLTNPTVGFVAEELGATALNEPRSLERLVEDEDDLHRLDGSSPLLPDMEPLPDVVRALNLTPEQLRTEIQTGHWLPYRLRVNYRWRWYLSGGPPMPRPSRGDKLVGPYAKPKVRGSGWAYQPGTLQLSQDQFIPLDSPAWLAWLDQQLAFRFEQVYYVAGRDLAEPLYLSYTVRPEPRQRGPLYWYAYKKYPNQRLPGTYLGQTASLTLTNLDQLALHFLAHINPQFYEQVCQVGLVRFRKVPQPDLDPQL